MNEISEKDLFEIFDSNGNFVSYPIYIARAREKYIEEVMRYVEVSEITDVSIENLARMIGVSVKSFKQLTYDNPKMAQLRHIRKSQAQTKVHRLRNRRKAYD